MVRYRFRCDPCDSEEVFYESMKKGPPDIVNCILCDREMYQVYRLQTKTNTGILEPYIEENLPCGPIEIRDSAHRDRIYKQYDVTEDRYSNLDRVRRNKPTAADQVTFDEVMTTIKKESGEWL